MHKLMYPNVTASVPLDYKWDGYESVTLFSSDDSLQQVADWCSKQASSVEKLHLDDSDLSLILFDGDIKVARFMAVAVEDEESRDDLMSYVSPKLFEPMLEKEPTIIGAFFVINPTAKS